MKVYDMRQITFYLFQVQKIYKREDAIPEYELWKDVKSNINGKCIYIVPHMQFSIMYTNYKIVKSVMYFYFYKLYRS